MPNIRIAINGAAGRMGRRLVALGTVDDELTIVQAMDFALHPDHGKDVGLIAGVGELGVTLSSGIAEQVDAVIDFSVPSGATAITEACVERGIPLVMATTGLSKSQEQMVLDAAGTIPIVRAPNMSLAVNLTMKLVETAAAALKDNPSGVDIEIIERHHRYKEDAPSGTALHFGYLIASIMGQTKHAHGRHGIPGKRPHDEIGYHALRVGDNPGEHTIVFGLLGETIELTVSATNRDAYAFGALAAAKFVARQEPGLYNMYDVLGL